MSKIVSIKLIVAIVSLGMLVTGCYVPMPSVGVKSTRVYHQETCTHIGSTGEVRCTHTRRYVK